MEPMDIPLHTFSKYKKLKNEGDDEHNEEQQVGVEKDHLDDVALVDQHTNAVNGEEDVDNKFLLHSVNVDEEEEDDVHIAHERKVEAEAEPAFPWKILLSVYFIVWTEAAVMNGFNPIIPGMCRDRFGMAEDMVSIASGFLVGGYIFATFLSSFFLGHLSDLFGRRKFMLLGSGMGAICSVGFGLAPFYWLAFLLRFVSGVCNANNALSRAVIADVVPRGPRRAQAYGYHGATVSFARAFSSALSGLTSGIIIDPNNQFLDDRYFLPAMFAALMQASAFVLNIIFVPESNKAPPQQKGESKSLLEGLREVKADPLMLKLILANCLSSFGNGAMLLGVVLYFNLSVDQYGLGMSAFYAGLAFGWFGLASVIFQMSFYKKLYRKVGILNLFHFGNGTLGLGCFLITSTSLVYISFGVTTTSIGVMWAVVSVHCCILGAGFVTCLPVITTMINNSANPTRQGLISGTAQSLSSFLRAFGPIVCGLIFSFSTAVKMPFLLFWFLTAVYGASFCLLHFGLSATEKERIAETDKAPS